MAGADPTRRVVRDVPVAATVCLVAIGLLFTAVAAVYFAMPAHDLPGLIPGSDPDTKRHHVKHGIAALLVGIAALTAAIFSGGGRPDWRPATRQADDPVPADGEPASAPPTAPPTAPAAAAEPNTDPDGAADGGHHLPIQGR